MASRLKKWAHAYVGLESAVIPRIVAIAVSTRTPSRARHSAWPNSRIFSLAVTGWPGVVAIPQEPCSLATVHLRGSDMAVFLAAHICPICGADAIDRVPRDGAVDHFVSLCGWRVYECCECRCRFYDWPSNARHYRNSVIGTLKHFSLCMRELSFELWRWRSRLIDRS